jgi:hypothetical protein
LYNKRKSVGDDIEIIFIDINMITIEQAQNPNTDPKLLAEVLSRGKDDWVSQWAAYNPNCPPQALAEVIGRGKDNVVTYCAIQNPNCPPQALADVLSRGKDDNISRCAAHNPSYIKYADKTKQAESQAKSQAKEEYQELVKKANRHVNPIMLLEVE